MLGTNAKEAMMTVFDRNSHLDERGRDLWTYGPMDNNGPVPMDKRKRDHGSPLGCNKDCIVNFASHIRPQ